MTIAKQLTPCFKVGGIVINPKSSTVELMKKSNLIQHKYVSFLSRYSNENTQKVVNSSIQDFISFLHVIKATLNNVNQDIINLYLNNLRQREIKNASYNLKVSNVKKYLEYIGIKGLEYKTARIESYGNLDLISESDFKSIIHYLNTMKDQKTNKQIKYLRDYLLYNLFFQTGLRKSEVLSLKHDDICLEGDHHMYSVKIKGGKEIKKQFPDNLLSLLNELKKSENKGNSDYVFTSKYKGEQVRLSHFTINKNLNAYHNKINKKKEIVTVHGIRNLSGWKVYQITNDILKVKGHLNHVNLNTTYRYLSKLENKTIDYYTEMEKALA